MGTASTRHRVAVIGGDGIGPEVCAEALKVVAAAGVDLQTTEFDLGAARFQRDGAVLPDEVLGTVHSHHHSLAPADRASTAVAAPSGPRIGAD